MVPKYSGRVMDKMILIVAQQTGSVRENPDDPAYPAQRSTVLETTVWALWRTRNRLQERRREMAKATKV